jgi:hypothetical protein
MNAMFGLVCTKYRRRPTMAQYLVASMGGTELDSDNIRWCNIGVWHRLQLLMPACSRILHAYTS